MRFLPIDEYAPLWMAVAACGAGALAVVLALNKKSNDRTSTTKKKNGAQQVVLVTGASSGIGKDAAIRLIRDGHIVYGAARRVNLMQDLVDAGGHAVGMDVTKEEQIVAAVARILQEQGRIDALVNNAGYAVYGSIEDVSMEDARRQFEVNLFGLARITKEVLPAMRQARSGCIVNISSIAGKIYTPFGAWYNASKHALEGWSDSLRLELEQFNIKVVVVEPGVIDTGIADDVLPKLVDRSKGSPYEGRVHKYLNQMDEMGIKGSDPSVVSNVISEALRLKHPPRRYLVGSLAKPFVFARNWLGDGVWDYLMLSNIR